MPYVSREGWGAVLAKGRSGWKSRDGIAFHWAGAALGIEHHEQCLSTIRRWQGQHMAAGGLGTRNGALDLAYNFVACEHGYVFEGRGANNATGANGTADANSRFLAICYMGGMGDDIPPAGYSALREAVELAVKSGFARKAYAHSDFTSTQCCGPVLYGKKDELVRTIDTAAATVTPIVLPEPTIQNLGAATLTRYSDFIIEIDAKGNGWRDLPVNRDSVVSLTPLSSNPFKEGYWEAPVIACQHYEGATRVVVTEGPPLGFVNVTAWVVT